MKIFAVYTKLHLTEQPDWLDGFREQYDKPWFFHNTLKQPCFIKDKELPELRSTLDRFFSEHPGNITVSFDEVVVDETKQGKVIMVRAKSAEPLVKLQKALVQQLAQYDRYIKPDHRQYEKDFDPHITIGRHLSDEQYREASVLLDKGCACTGMIDEVVFAVVKDDTVEEGMNPANHTVYRL